MNKEEIIERLEEIAKHAVHVLGEEPFFMSLDDGIAIHEAIDILKSAQPEIIRCKYCKHRHEAECPMYHEEDIEWDDDGYIERETIYHDWTEDDGYCDRGERREA